MDRKSEVKRKTNETEIKVALNIDGKGKYKISTEVPFMNHMLELFSKHGEFDLEVEAKGDVKVDPHHMVEDLGLCIGTAFFEALGKKGGINRFGHAIVPMDEALCLFSIDVSGRPFFTIKGKLEGKIGSFDSSLVKDFFLAFANESKTTIHIHLLSGENPHHKIECIFKAFGRALKMAVEIVKGEDDIPSTKGII